MKAKKSTAHSGSRGLRKVVLGVVIGIIVFVAAIALAAHANVAVLSPQGYIAGQQKRLIVFASILALFVIVPVYVMTFGIAWKYRATNTKVDYSPEWDHSAKAETVWWGIPIVLILILSIVTWQSTHALDPFKPLDSGVRPVTIQVVALQWKWLFIYPDLGIATVNYLNVPTGTPINFKITSDAPMNSFWIPQLGGQVYAMSGMSTQLHLMADRPGDYQGVSANLSGEGFAGMKFIASAMSPDDFDTWTAQPKDVAGVLDQSTYAQLAKPSKDSPQATYTLGTTGLYDKIVMKYMSHSGDEGYMGQDTSPTIMRQMEMQ